MTSPISDIRVQCPACGTEYEDWYRASINRDLDPEMDDDYIDEASTATCPACGHRVDLGTLVVEGGVWHLPAP
jgi:hypothetical protein